MPVIAPSPAPLYAGAGGTQDLHSSRTQDLRSSPQQGFPWPFLLQHFLLSSPQLKNIRAPCARTMKVMAARHHCPGKIMKWEAPYGNTEHNCKIKTQMAEHLQRRLRLYCCTGSFKTDNLQLACLWEKMHDGCKAQFWLEILIRKSSRD